MRASPVQIPEAQIDVIEGGRHPRKNAIAFDLDRDFECSPEKLAAYAFSKWESVIFDAMAVAASLEFADRVVKRAAYVWERRIAVRIPVHDPGRWSDPKVSDALHDAISFLTGDIWSINFIPRKNPSPSPPQEFLNLAAPTQAIIAYSDGMDSRAVFGIVSAHLSDKLLRVRVGSKSWDQPDSNKGREPFTKVPYDVPCNMSDRETSSRSRGFKFALITGIAAYLTDASEIIIPESGQGIFGPVFVSLGHAYPDYRNHPLFTARMERFLHALLGSAVRYVFPRIWHTKGETLSEFVAVAANKDWQSTRSCWRNSQWASVNSELRQCGVCAACMLRRLSVHAAGLREALSTYVCVDLSASELLASIDPSFTRYSRAYRDYAIAGAQHLDYMAGLAADDARQILKRHSWFLAPTLGISQAEAEDNLRALFGRHAKEWHSYMASVGDSSFLKEWVRSGQ